MMTSIAPYVTVSAPFSSPTTQIDGVKFAVQAGERGKNKNAMTGSEIAAQTSLLLLAGQDTTVSLIRTL